jgi:hypothetical protein
MAFGAPVITRKRTTVAILVLLIVTAGVAASPAGAATRLIAQTFVFDGAGTISFGDRPPAGPSPGDTEHVTERLRDAAGRIVGTARSSCVFTRVIPNDVLERCSASGTTSEGTLLFGGVGHLNSTNPPWQVTGGTGAYKGAHGQLIFERDILVFDQPARRRLPRALLAELEKLGQPPASSGAWRNVLKARHAALTNETRQIKTALAGDAPAFVHAVYQQARDYNQLVFTSAVFGVQSCTFT